MDNKEIKEAIEETKIKLDNLILRRKDCFVYEVEILDKNIQALQTLIHTAEEYLKLKDIIKKLKVDYPDPKIASEHIYQLLLGQIKSLLDEEITNPERRV